MSGPKHLWSGDWESESVRPDAAPRVLDPEPENLPEPERSPLFTKRQILIAISASLATAAAALALVNVFDGSPRRLANRPPAHRHVVGPNGQASKSGGQGLTAPSQAQICQRNPAACRGTSTPVVSGPSADWLGMQIITSPAGVVISTVALGSPADQAGFEPGDEIEEVDNHQISTVSQLRADTNGVRIGAPVSVQVLRASAMLPAASMPMTQRPTIHP